MSPAFKAILIALGGAGSLAIAAAGPAADVSASAPLPASAAHYGVIRTQRIRFNNAPLWQKANAAVGRGDDPAAIRFFNEILANDPGSNPAKLSLISLYARQGRYDDGLALCADLLGAYPDRAEIWNSKGALEMKQQLYPQAAESLEHALRLTPAEAPQRRNMLLSLGQAHRRAGQDAAAQRALAQALAIEFTPDAAMESYFILKDLKTPEQGSALLERVLAGAPPPAMRREALYELAQLNLRAGRWPAFFQGMDELIKFETEARRLDGYALELSGAGDPDRAIRALAKSFDLETDARKKYETAMFAARLDLQQGRAGAAKAWLDRAAPFAGPDALPSLALELARAEFMAGNDRAASDRLLALGQRPPEATLLLGFAFSRRGLPGPALACFNELDDLDALAPEQQLNLLKNRAYLNFGQHQYAAALMDAEEALDLAPAADMALLRLKALANTDGANEVEKEGAILLDPQASELLLTGAEQAQVLLVMGRQLLRQGQPGRAIRRLADAAERDPALSEAFYLQGLAWHALGKSGAALTNYQAYSRLEPRPPATFWGDLGQAEGARRNYQQGAAALDRSLAHHSVDVDTLSDQGYQYLKWAFPCRGTNESILDRWNHNREAKAAFRRAIDLYADLTPRVPTNKTAAYREREVAMKQEFTKLDRLIGIQAYLSRTDYGFPTNVGISSVDGALPSQGGLELSLRPPIVGFLNERTLDLFGTVNGNFQRRSWTPDPDSYQGMVGLRLKPFIGFNYNMSFARLFKIGANSENNWLWRNMGSWERGEKPAPGKTVGLNLKGFGDVGYYFEPRTRWYGYLDGRAGASWRLRQEIFLTAPQLMGILRYETNDEGDTGSYGLAGIGATLRLFEPERRHAINRLYADLFAHYTWGRFMSTPAGFDGRSFDGPMIGVSLVK